MGSDAIALPTLEYLFGEKERVSITAVYTQPDKARGRGKKVQPNAIKNWAIDRGIHVFQPDTFGEEEIQELYGVKAEVILVMAYGHLLPQSVLDAPAQGIFNIHTSLLPQLRGASPIETAVASGMEESGVTLMRLVKKMDAGPVCDQERLSIELQETGGSFREKLALASPPLLQRNLHAILDGKIQSAEQNQEAVSYCRLLVKQDGQLDFTQPAQVLAHRINGLNPWPGCFAELDGVNLKIGLASFLDSEETVEPGIVIACDSDGVQVGTGRGVVNFHSLQKPGGKMLPAASYLLGNPIVPGSQFISQEMHPLMSKKPISHKRVFQLYAKP